MFQHLINIFKQHDIEWWATDGTMLGALRCGGLIRWDDDIDIALDEAHYDKMKSLRKLIETPHYKMKFVGQYAKLEHIPTKDSTGEASLWIDIFKTKAGIYPQKHCQICNAPDDMRLPLRKIQYSGLEIFIANKAEELCDREYPDWRVVADVYNHRAPKKKKVKGDIIYTEWGGYHKLGKHTLSPQANIPYITL